MRAPEFWSRRDSLLPLLLAPLSALYDIGSQARMALTSPREAPIPIVCVGNAVVGGAGKTPCAMALVARLRALGADAHCVSRGYGGCLTGPTRVDLSSHSSDETGDEPLLLARAAPTWVAKDKYAGARAAAEAGADVVVLDDGLQNPTLKKDLSCLVIDALSGVGNGRVLPAGPLREPLQRALSRVEAAIVLDGTGSGDDGGWPELLDRINENVPVFRAQLVPTVETLFLTERPVVAFAGLGNPDKFFALLRNMGCDVVETHAFPDHHRFTPDELMHLVERAAAQNARPVTTAKDAVRLPDEARTMIDVAEVVVEFENAPGIDSLLKSVVHKAPGQTR